MRLILVCICLLLPSLNLVAADQYSVKVHDDGNALDVEVCFDGKAPRRLYRDSSAASITRSITIEGKPWKGRTRDDSLSLPSLPANACMQWQVGLDSAIKQAESRYTFELGGARVISTSAWFWKGPWERETRVEVSLPAGTQISVPWTPVSGDLPNTYIPSRTPSSWTSRTVIGNFHRKRLEIGGATIELAMTGNLEPPELDKLEQWLVQPLQSVADVLGYFPQPYTQVLVHPIGRRNEPVPWARVVRGGGPAVEFFVDENRSLDQFHSDWTATHEFSHLFLPLVSRNDRWLSEGFASYYQNVLQARDGRLSETEAWQKLHNGFKRGERQANDKTLAEATRSGWNSTMRVYWSGAAMMLQADKQLREQSDNAHSLDTAIKAFNQCCMTTGKAWSARDLLAELDRLTQSNVFSTLYRENVDSRQFPDLSDTYAELGLKTRFGRVGLNSNAPLADVRKSIMTAVASGNTAKQGADNAP